MTCDTCQHWGRHVMLRQPYRPCQNPRLYVGYPLYLDTEEMDRLSASDAVIVQGDTDLSLMTLPTFFCAHWAAKED